MTQEDDAPIEEPDNPKLVPATFVLQLDAFDMRTQQESPAVSRAWEACHPADRLRL
jgi:hypothetical protein